MTGTLCRGAGVRPMHTLCRSPAIELIAIGLDKPLIKIDAGIRVAARDFNAMAWSNAGLCFSLRGSWLPENMKELTLCFFVVEIFQWDGEKWQRFENQVFLTLYCQAVLFIHTYEIYHKKYYLSVGNSVIWSRHNPTLCKMCLTYLFEIGNHWMIGNWRQWSKPRRIINVLGTTTGHIRHSRGYKEKARWGRYRANISYREILERI